MSNQSQNIIDLVDIKEYKGKQIVLNSNRLVFNADEDSILFTSPKYINLSAGEKVTIDVGKSDSKDAKNQFLVNSPNIQFGLAIKGKSVEPAVKGDTLAKILEDILETLELYDRDLSASTGPTVNAVANTASFGLRLEITRLKLKIQEMKSDVVFLI